MKPCAFCATPIVRAYKLSARRWALPMYCDRACELAAREQNLPQRRQAYFWKKVTIAGPDDCWLWNGYCDPNGYARYGRLLASRIAFELEREPIPDGLCVCHRCDNPRCVNPAHLWLGTQPDNVADMVTKGRAWWQRRSHAAR